jgi:hypothetical protein
MPDKIVVGLVSRTFFNMPLWIGIENGFFADADLEVETSIFGNASQVPPLLDGTFQFVIGSPEVIMQNAAGGGPLRIIAGNAGKLVHSLIARAPFQRIEDLRGATRLEEPAAHAAGPARGGDRAPASVHQDREVERAARDAEGRSRGAAQGCRRREDPALP